MRYPSIPESEWNAAQRDLAKALTDGPRGVVRGPFVPLLHAPGLAAKVHGLGDLVRYEISLPQALIELATCMTARARACPYVWVSHSKAAMKAGVAPSTLTAIARLERPDGMTPDETLVHDFCNEMLNVGKVSEATFGAVATRWNKSVALEIAGLCGYYSLLACVLITADHPLPAGVQPFSVS